MIIFDFEVFRYNWLVVFKDAIDGTYTTIIDDKNKLQDFYNKNKHKLFVGYNSSNYDVNILKGILLGFDPYNLSNIIINGDNRIYNIINNPSWYEIDLYSYDVSFGLGFTSLKENEAYMGLSIVETPIDFNMNRELTKEELEEVCKYCKNDVDATEILFRKCRDSFETKVYLCKEFGLDKSYLNRCDQAIIERVLGARKRYNCTDENEPFDFSQLNLKIKKYKDVVDYFSLPTDEQKGYGCLINGVLHSFGIGGIHGAIPNFRYEGKLMNIDVASYYPSMMVVYDWFARSIPNEKKQLYAKMKKDRVALKKTNKGLANAYKLILNTTYGCYKCKFTNLLDPRMANNICIGGQVMLVDLLENLEPYCMLVQSNTDGIIIIPKDEDKIKEIVKDWEQRTGMEMEITYGTKIYQKDVNNYVMETEKGIKCVGGYVAQYNGKGNRRTMSIVDKAIVNYLIYGVSVEDYIKSNNDPLDYQIISKVGKTYDRVFYELDGKEIETNRVNRVFASFKPCRLYKQKNGKGRECVANQPPNSLVYNESLDGFNIDLIDKQWYIDMAKSRINDYLGGR